ncbi:nicolin-1-like isoform X2 [Biomphalaria glabrata]|uniref:Nicolin-1-like isoform X2 n=1 Tax=Biomphalaria glabrata TaxID=6526 RepID=A0A9W3A545_BIOGL|nr:nicolin-1-like isoform X2 [Biomphalaria glabrata]
MNEKWEKPINCTIKHTVTLSPSSGRATASQGIPFHSGCKAIDVYFPSVINPEIGAVEFQNDYAAFITIRVKTKATDQATKPASSDQDWKTVVNAFKLMPDCHAEMGSQDTFCITRKQFACDLNNVISLRFILQQPSPMWKDFNIHKIKLFKSSGNRKHFALPNWLTESGSSKPRRKELEPGNDLMTKTEMPKVVGVPDIDILSSNLQQMWALAEEAAANQPEQSIGRYEVDGCYDINLLAYT